ncbi:deoxyhypusine synthase family protein [Capsulimonas corticalis]|uniref:deoxyhypusine synthase family protein n=1 Tax=Capsulimonas corticalis TaxID=2219043 RepID=UPI000E65C5BE|nr:deoxyhypusine synthase family protein [Capsulimonas corticalis]
MTIREFMDRNYRHFNSAVCVDAARAWNEHLDKGGKMFLTLAGAMSTAELGISVAELIRNDKVHGICCTGANLEEDVFNLVAHTHYERIPQYRALSAADEVALRDRGMNRVTDTCIPEDQAIRRIEDHVLELWKKADQAGESFFPYEFMYQLLGSGVLEGSYEIDPKDSWLLAAREKGLPIFVPGWEDSTLANIFTSHVISGDISRYGVVKTGVELMGFLVHWYKEITANSSLGFFQVGGGIAGDFPICVVPLIAQDLQEECRLWGYFAQISDSTTSYGSYSGAVPNEKITWGKLDSSTPSFIIESDATIVAPLIFNYVLGN